MNTELLKNIFTNNFATWVIIFSLFVILIGNRFRDKYTNTLFFCYLGTLVLLNIADITDYYYFNQDYFSPIRYLGSLPGYVLKTVVLVILILILFRREKHNKRIWLIWIPLIIETIFVFTSPFTHLVFYYTETNNFIRGPLTYLPHFISAIYIVIFLVYTFVFSSKFDRTEVITVCLIVTFSVLATIFESKYSYKFLVTSALAISCIVYYLYFYVRQSHIDDLTGLYNRQSFFNDINKVKHKELFIIMIDLDGLKSINDKFGHAAGDKALMVLSSCLVKAIKNKSNRAYRVGGDEFTVIIFGSDIKEVETYIDNAVEELKKTQYMASFGYAKYKPGDSFDECLKNSDTNMYKIKDKTYKR